jgi:hypothetical protein
VGVRPGEGMVTGLSNDVGSKRVCMEGKNVDVSWSFKLIYRERKVEGRCDSSKVSS